MLPADDWIVRELNWKLAGVSVETYLRFVMSRVYCEYAKVFGILIISLHCTYFPHSYSNTISLNWSYSFINMSIQCMPRQSTVPPRNNLSKTASETRPRRVPPASAGARRRVRAASRPHPTRVRSASAGARRRVYPRELLAFVACGREWTT